jgi:hypothetical protein
MLVFRIVHIGAAVVWVGMVVFFAVFLTPTASELGPAAFPVMKELVEKRKVPKVIQSIAGVTVIGGLFLYWRDWHAYGGLGNFVGSAFGLTLTVGAISAISAFVVGNFLVAKNVERLIGVGSTVAAAGGPPAPEFVAETQQLAARIRLGSRIVLLLLAITVFAMATARYW